MAKQITFKRNHVEFAGCITLIIAFIAVLVLAYFSLIYVPEIKDEPYVDPNENTK